MINVKSFQTYPDASGAPAVIVVDGWMFRMDCPGEPTCDLLTQSGGKPSKKTIALAKWKYSKLLADLGDDWRARNRAMYEVTP